MPLFGPAFKLPREELPTSTTTADRSMVFPFSNIAWKQAEGSLSPQHPKNHLLLELRKFALRQSVSFCNDRDHVYSIMELLHHFDIQLLQPEILIQ